MALNKSGFGLDGQPVNKYNLDGTPWTGGKNLDGSPRT